MFIPYLKFEFARMIGSRNAVRGVAITICIHFAAPITVQAQQQGAGDKATSAVTFAPGSSPEHDTADAAPPLNEREAVAMLFSVLRPYP